MCNLSEKELSAVQDILSEEELAVKKFKMLAQKAEDEAVKNKLLDIAGKHQGHFDLIYSYLG